MNKTILICGIIFFSGSISHSQEVLGSIGATYVNSSLDISCTLGEVIIETYNGSQVDLTQGFHQPEITVDDSGIKPTSNLVISVYPNPTTNHVFVNVENFQGIRYQLFGMDGKLISEASLQANSTLIDLSSLERGIYVISISSEVNQANFESYKLIKH
ncbi:MAG: T9SS type A sorting domain-containing protein [Crocinitomicaceae bacterium]|nr:T9SS type A sorting domain-containing protein [Crocinitomicaceae bacterium]